MAYVFSDKFGRGAAQPPFSICIGCRSAPLVVLLLLLLILLLLTVLELLLLIRSAPHFPPPPIALHPRNFLYLLLIVALPYVFRLVEQTHFRMVVRMVVRVYDCRGNVSGSETCCLDWVFDCIFV